MLAKERQLNVDPSTWKVVRADGQDESTPRQTYGNDCGVFAIMYAIYKVRDLTYDYTVDDMPFIRKWIAANILKEEESFSNVSYNDDTSETEEVKETDRATSDPGKTRPQQEIINMDRSFFERGDVGSFVPKESQKSCYSGNNGRKRKKVEKGEEKNKENGSSTARKSAKKKRKLTKAEKAKRFRQKYLNDATDDSKDAAMKHGETKETLLQRVRPMRQSLAEIMKNPRSITRPKEQHQRHQAFLNFSLQMYRKKQIIDFGTKYFGSDFCFELLGSVTQLLNMMFTEPTTQKPGSLWLPPRTFVDLPPNMDPSGIEGYYYINDVLAEEAITFLIMELEECDYRTATGFAVFGTPTPIDTFYHDEWYELLNAQTNRPSITDKEARKKYDARIKTFLDASAAVISFGDVPWPCDGDAQDKVAVMMKKPQEPK